MMFCVMCGFTYLSGRKYNRNQIPSSQWVDPDPPYVTLRHTDVIRIWVRQFHASMFYNLYYSIYIIVWWIWNGYTAYVVIRCALKYYVSYCEINAPDNPDKK